MDVRARVTKILTEYFEGPDSLEGYSVQIRAEYPSCASDPVPVEIRDPSRLKAHARFLAPQIAWDVLAEFQARGAQVRDVRGTLINFSVRSA